MENNYGYIRSNGALAYSPTAAPATSCPGCGHYQAPPSSQLQLKPAVHSTGYQHVIAPPYQQNSVVISQPVAHNTGAGSAEEKGRPWTSGLCGCFERFGSCVCGFCCLPFFACFLSERLDESFFGPLCCCCFMVALRTRQRSKLDIKGSVCRDVFAMLCCPCCAATQMYRELKASTM